MKRPTFIQGVVVAAFLAFFTTAIVTTFTPLMGLGAVVRLVIPVLGLAYILYLFSRTEVATGRVTTLALWGVMSLGNWWFAPPIGFYLIGHVAALWLVRSIYFYSGILPVLADLGLNALAAATAVWAITQTGSTFLATWCFFLVQALFVAIPPAVDARHGRRRTSAADEQQFEQARRRADAALRQLFT